MKTGRVLADVGSWRAGDSGKDRAPEFRVTGLDDGNEKYASHVLPKIWNALKDATTETPYPHRVVEMEGGVPQ